MTTVESQTIAAPENADNAQVIALKAISEDLDVQHPTNADILKFINKGRGTPPQGGKMQQGQVSRTKTSTYQSSSSRNDSSARGPIKPTKSSESSKDKDKAKRRN